MFARVALYLVFTLNTSNDPGVNLLAIAMIIGTVLFLSARVGRIYRSNVVDWGDLLFKCCDVQFSAVVFTKNWK